MSFPLAGQSVASFYANIFAALSTLGVHVRLERPNPFDLPDADRPFASDTEHDAHDTVTLFIGVFRRRWW